MLDVIHTWCYLIIDTSDMEVFKLRTMFGCLGHNTHFPHLNCEEKSNSVYSTPTYLHVLVKLQPNCKIYVLEYIESTKNSNFFSVTKFWYKTRNSHVTSWYSKTTLQIVHMYPKVNSVIQYIHLHLPPTLSFFPLPYPVYPPVFLAAHLFNQ